jgi:hypothetical protein
VNVFDFSGKKKEKKKARIPAIGMFMLFLFLFCLTFDEIFLRIGFLLVALVMNMLNFENCNLAVASLMFLR